MIASPVCSALLCHCGGFEPSLDFAWQWPWRGSSGQPQRPPVSPEATTLPLWWHGVAERNVCVCVCIAKLSAIYFIFSKKNLCIKFRKITDNLPQPWGGYSLLCVVSQVGMLHFYKIKTFQLLFVPEPTEMEQTFKYKSPFLMLNSFS